MPFNPHNKFDNISLILLIRKTNSEKLSSPLGHCHSPNRSQDLLSGSLFWKHQVLLWENQGCHSVSLCLFHRSNNTNSTLEIFEFTSYLLLITGSLSLFVCLKIRFCSIPGDDRGPPLSLYLLWMNLLKSPTF